MTTTTEQTEQAKKLHAALAAVDVTKISVLSDDRHIPRKTQAALARSLFKSLGISGISITTPNHSMASMVDVRMPSREDYNKDEFGRIFNYLSDPAAVANSAARLKVLVILGAAFPNHDDRSDSQTDYFDRCWSVQ